MTELDKFKRRTIRSVARLLLQKKPPDELWSEMKKETGTDCRVLWERMRALCIKKLNRMLAVDDRADSLPSIARLTLTDWLLVDLVLVHEEIDVIAMEREDSKTELKPLTELFGLVQRFEVEGRVGEPLAEAWAAATVFYNCQGRQCSPMLLQRRWYQLKKLTRCRFYKFWFSYRGNTRLLDEAKSDMPSRLEMAVAKRYPSVITKPFPEWEELIKQRLVILPEEFESKMRLTKRSKPNCSNDPDLVVVEPVIETIDLRVESDPEDEPKDDTSEDTSDPEKSNETAPQIDQLENVAKQNNEILGVKIKTEPIEEDGLSNVQVIAATHVPEVDIRDTDSPEPVDESQNQTENKNIEDKQDSPDDEDDDVIEIPNVIPVVNVDLESPTKNVQEKPQEETQNKSFTDNDNDDIVDDIIKIKADAFCSKEPKNLALVDGLIKDKADTYLNTPKEKNIINEIERDTKAIESINQESNLTGIDFMADLNFVDDGIEFVDDGVEFVEEDNESIREPLSASEKNNEDSGSKFDLKLLMDPVVYTTRLEHMRFFGNKQVDSVENKEDIEKIVSESKPVSGKSFNINVKLEHKTSQADTEADDTGASDDLFTNQEESSDEEFPESAKVSINSYMLRKPKCRSYNPIQLCKNPDFNTKLRRLNIGFFTSIRNRELLNVCIPMTIDVSKSFESRLVNGTLYLKPTGTSMKAEPNEVVDNQTSAVVPSALPVQSVEKAITNVPELVPSQSTAPDPIVSERKKVISLPDIEKVRKINQQLLTAQVPPIRVYAGDRPPPLVPIIQTNPVEQMKQSDQPIPSPPSPSNIMEILPMVVKVKSEANLEGKTVMPAPENFASPELPPAKKKLQKIINRAKVLTQVALTKIDVGAKVSETNELKQITLLRKVDVKPKPKENFKKYNFQRVSVPWKPKIRTRAEQIDDFLITSDTLNKMLHLMGRDAHDSNCPCCTGKLVGKKKSKKKKNPAFAQDSSKKQDQNTPVTKKTLNVTSPKSVLARGRVFRYCCWARQKMLNRKRIMKHTCPPEQCSCCCRNELAKSVKKNQERMNMTAIELSDDEEKSLQKACESIENVVQQSRTLTKATYRLEDSAPKSVVAEDSTTPTTEMASVPYRLKVLDESALKAPANETALYVPSSETPLCVPAAGTLLDVAVQIPPDETADQIQLPIDASVGQTLGASVGRISIGASVGQISLDATVCQTSLDTTIGQTLLGASVGQIPLHTSVQGQTLAESVDQISLGASVSQISANTSVGQILLDATIGQTSFDATALGQIQHIVSAGTTLQPPCPALSKLSGPLQRNKPVPEPQHTHFQSKLTYSGVSNPCSCQTPALSQDSQRNIVIDASKTCPIHMRHTPVAHKNCNKVLYLHSKTLAKSPSENPIYLGKNKILLTTVKFPRKEEETAPEIFQPPKIIPNLELPPGVQLMMLASGCVTYTLDQGTELTEAQLASLPSIIAAVQEQLNSVGPSMYTSVNTDINSNASLIDLPPEANIDTQTIESPVPMNLEAQEVFVDEELSSKNLENEDTVPVSSTPLVASVASNTPMVTQADEAVQPSSKENEPELSAEKTVSTTYENTPAESSDTHPESDVSPSVSNETKSEVMSEIKTKKQCQEGNVLEDREKVAEKADDSNVKEVPNNRKSLLSDLMEMSGISAEDTKPTELQQTLTENQSGQIPGVGRGMLTVEQTMNLPELTPVTSFAELKYACEQNGKFFKLDYESGIIVPINVCIKRNIKNKPGLNSKAVIDLTDDIDETNDGSSSHSTEVSPEQSLLKKPVQYMYNGQMVNVTSTVKPIKLFKACRPPLLKRCKKLDSIDYVPPKKKTHLEKRKQALHKLEARIDLVDSDAPMEEEYLMDSSDDEGPMLRMKSIDLEALDLDALDDSDDSSDDEPLAKKSKRMKDSQQTDIETIRLTINTRDQSILIPEVAAKVTESEGTDLTVPRDHEGSQSEADNEELDKDTQPVLKFMSDPSDAEGGEDDCILGV